MSDLYNEPVFFKAAETDLTDITGIRLEVLTDDKLPNKGPGRASDGNFVLTELEVVARDGVLEIAVADVPARVDDRRGDPVIVTDGPMKPLTVEDVRAAIDRVRR